MENGALIERLDFVHFASLMVRVTGSRTAPPEGLIEKLPGSTISSVDLSLFGSVNESPPNKPLISATSTEKVVGKSARPKIFKSGARLPE